MKTYEASPCSRSIRRKDVEGRPYIESLPGFAPYLKAIRLVGIKASPGKLPRKSSAPRQEVNAALQNDLQKGQTAINLVFDRVSHKGLDPDHARREEIGQDGVSMATLEDLKTILEGIDLEGTPIFIQAGIAAVAAQALLLAFAQTSRKAFTKLQGGVKRSLGV